MNKLFSVGDTIYGFCNGAFGRNDYETKICVMVTPKYAVFQFLEGEWEGKATVLNNPDRWDKETVDKWKCPEDTNAQETDSPHFDIDRPDLYEFNKPRNRTRKRLIEIAECGMGEVGIAQFGYKGVMSGLYIEMVWNYSDESFNDYMEWAKGLIAESLKKIIQIKK